MIYSCISEKLFQGRGVMIINKKEVLTPWSLRDISKLFARI
jgi:hypothetical protein